MGFTKPTEIQTTALPPALAGQDVLASAMTGSGKTAAFVLPILNRLMGGPRGRIRALVVTPTRELASQVHQHFRDLGRHTNIRSAAVFGGVKPGPQERALRGGVEVVVACPGRLLDHMRQSWLRFDHLEVLVLDEADRMLDMGFLPDIRRILDRLPERRQTMLFSATLPAPIVALSRSLLNHPVRLGTERRTTPATGIHHAALSVSEEVKKDLLLDLLHDEVKNALVFTRTKHRANRLAKYLEKAGIPSDRIHGNRSQPQRESALAAFKSGRIRVLVATDVAARGIDVEGLSHVINFDVPNQPEDYVHRVGRTARAGATGEALTFVSRSEEAGFRAIERTVGRRIDRRQIHLSGRRVNGTEPVPSGDRSGGAVDAETSRGASAPSARRPRRKAHPKGHTNAQPSRSARRASKPTVAA
jgi:ATP-dependent RNA helicase RhlE